MSTYILHPDPRVIRYLGWRVRQLRAFGRSCCIVRCPRVRGPDSLMCGEHTIFHNFASNTMRNRAKDRRLAGTKEWAHKGFKLIYAGHLTPVARCRPVHALRLATWRGDKRAIQLLAYLLNQAGGVDVAKIIRDTKEKKKRIGALFGFKVLQNQIEPPSIRRDEDAILAEFEAPAVTPENQAHDEQPTVEDCGAELDEGSGGV